MKHPVASTVPLHPAPTGRSAGCPTLPAHRSGRRLDRVIEQDVLERVLAGATSGGADFAEVYAEDKRSTSAGLDDGRIEQVTSGRDKGAGIRVVAGDTTGFAYTSDLSEVGLRAAADAAAAAAARGGGGVASVGLV